MVDSGNGQERRVAVIVVHGVGDKLPGSTVNDVVDSLRQQTNDRNGEPIDPAQRFNTSVYSEVYQLKEPDTSWQRALNDAKAAVVIPGASRSDEFPVYARHALGPAGQASFFELHWADLARSGSGWLDTAKGFARFIFEIPHVIDGFLRDPPCDISRLLRRILLFVTCYVRGPLAGYCAVMLFGGLAFLSFEQIPNQEDVKRLLSIEIKKLDLTKPIPPDPLYRFWLSAGLIGLIAGALVTAILGRKRVGVWVSALFVGATAAYYLLDALFLDPDRYPVYAGFVYLDYLRVALAALAAGGLYAFLTRRHHEVGFADLGLFTTFWALFFMVDLSPLGEWLRQTVNIRADVVIKATVATPSSETHFKAFELYYPFLKYIWAVWALLVGIAFLIALWLWLRNRTRWALGYRGIFAALALTVVQACVWLSILPALGVMHMDDVLCRGNRHPGQNEKPPVSCQLRLSQNAEVLGLLKQIKQARSEQQLVLAAGLESTLDDVVRRRDTPLNQPMLTAMHELAISFVWHSVCLFVAIMLALGVAGYRHVRTNRTILNVEQLRLPRLIVSAWVLIPLCILGIINVGLTFSWIPVRDLLEVPGGSTLLPIVDAFREMLSSWRIALGLPGLENVPSETVQMALMSATAVMLLSQVSFIMRPLGGVMQIMRGLIDHQYRTNVSISRRLSRRAANEPIRRVHIAERLKKLMNDLVIGKSFDEVVFLSHSQGTVIVYEYLKHTVSPQDFASTRIRVLTVGSPLGEIYAYYFNEYSDLNKRLGGLAVQPVSWTNMYRNDDPIGGPYQQAGHTIDALPFEDIELPAGGHLDYWKLPIVCDVIRQMLRGQTPNVSVRPKPALTGVWAWMRGRRRIEGQ